MPSIHGINSRPSSTTTSTTQLERSFTHRFLRSLRRLRSPPNTKPPPTSPPPPHAARLMVRRRSLRIKLAAYSSMARAVGTHRAWSRALLSRISSRRHRPARHDPRRSRRRRKTKSGAGVGLLKKKIKVVVRREPSRAGKLRELVPGGSRMEMCKLLEETAHYVQCLAVQVRVMQTVADHYSDVSI